MPYSESIKREIIASLPDYVMQFCETDKHFNSMKGGIFKCPICGGTGKVYRQNSMDYPYNIKMFECDHFSKKSDFKGDSFGIYAATHNLTTQEAFKELMANEGGFSPMDEISRMRYDEAVRKRQEKQKEWERLIAQTKAYNRSLIESNTQWGKAMTDSGKALLEQRGIHINDIPESYSQLVGYLPRVWFKKQDDTGTYPIEGIVFRLGESTYQIRKTHGLTYVSKDEKTSRFMTIGDADLFGLKAEDDTVPEPLFIVEGPFDALSLVQAGARRVISMQGCQNQGKIAEHLYHMKPKCGGVLIALDSDKAGLEAVGKLYNALAVDKKITPVKAPFLSDEKIGIHDANDWLKASPEGLRTVVNILKMEGWLFARGWETEDHFQVVMNHIAEEKSPEKKIHGKEAMEDLKAQYHWFKGGYANV